MPVSRFCALALAPEIQLSSLAAHFGITRRFAWEDPLELTGKHLPNVLAARAGQRVFLFAFGAAVFVDCNEKDMLQVLATLAPLHTAFSKKNPLQWRDHYTLTIAPGASARCNSEGLVIEHSTALTGVILATVLAKSVALERVEASLEMALDQSEKRIESLEKGKLRGADTSLAREAGAVLRLEHESVHYLGLLDKPECTWSDEQADALYTLLERQFELRERFNAVRNRVEVLKDLGSTFADLAHARRATQLEWIIILLIAFEIVLPAGKWLWQHVIQGS